ncbi:phospholipase D-like domain-containing protein [uncultured Sphingomonas sp.]|uniref:phospholipase D-like domain-containing protein n=1 Tax=uncultured Sphingomonas sp. TaxID=158754 RepID=UPI0026110AEC|nr:phospholipase D-like domain-containing protein [uncultured Sphingomonas sp.]
MLVTREFILQGLTARTHGDVVRELFDVADVQRSIISVAFLMESGINQIAPKFAAHAGNTSVFAGIRNDITSYQGMKRLLDAGVALHAVDTGSRHLLFHPKLYYVRGKKLARLSIGSANLTLGGLNNNIEAGVLLDFDVDDKDDAKFLKELEKQFDGLTAAHPDNIFRIKKVKRLNELLAAGLLADEAHMPPQKPTTSAKPGSSDPTPRMKMAVPAIKSSPKKASKPKLSVPVVPVIIASDGGPVPAAAPAVGSAGVGYEVVWISKDLTERDLTIPTGDNTNPTGSINLDKGLMEAEVDHRHYFRDEVFPSLIWTPRSATVDEAVGTFQVVLKGVDYGSFDMNIRHTTSTTSKSYLQKNAMTRLSWGEVAAEVKRPDLIGRSMALYRDLADPTKFMIEID